MNQWNEGQQSGESSRNAVAMEGGLESKGQPAREFDLYDLVSALGERVQDSVWLGSDVDCYGEAAKELFSFTDQNLPMDGKDFLRIASGILQTIKGDFQAFDPVADSPWIFIRAWKGSGFYVETNDPKIKKRLQTRFPSIEQVEGATPPYVGLFIYVQ